ncbi:MAG TPA: hypothetical protein VF988_11360 [Verrucomicrobiae bacterium]
MGPLIQCPQCRTWLLEGVFNRPDLGVCRSCGAQLQIEVFPALFRKIAPGQSAEAVLVDGESSCFFHPQKKATRPCDGCGRFLCALCDCELRGQHFCPTCLETGRSKGKIEGLDHRRTRYDRIALWVAILPMLVFPLIYFTIITAPLTLFICIRYWKAPPSLVHRTRVRLVIAGIVALLEIGAWIAVLAGIATRH